MLLFRKASKQGCWWTHSGTEPVLVTGADRKSGGRMMLVTDWQMDLREQLAVMRVLYAGVRPFIGPSAWIGGIPDIYPFRSDGMDPGAGGP
uniref:Uncharacterized protein n=1 Tax=Bionectria ochroleuca TaxID=29856 RepID=A0A0B7JRB1_BIOOC